MAPKGNQRSSPSSGGMSKRPRLQAPSWDCRVCGIKGNWNSFDRCRRCKCPWGSKLAQPGSQTFSAPPPFSLEGALGSQFVANAKEAAGGNFDLLERSYAEVVQQTTMQKM